MRALPRALLIVLLAAIGSTSAQAQPLRCYPIRRGDTASRLAIRITGNADNQYQPWFHIVDPAGRSIPKSRYGGVHSGWQVCVATQMVRPRPAPELVQRGVTPAYELASAPLVLPTAQTAFTPSAPPSSALTFLWWAAPLVALVSGLITARASRYIARRRLLLDIMRTFAERFVIEFERPLFRRAGTSPVRSRLRFAPARHRLEIRLAPGEGRVYPNLADHKKNVEYDVGRVLRLLKDEPFTNGPLYAEGPWVVIPCCLAVDREQEGVR